MRIDVITLFPELVHHAARFGVTGRALERGIWRSVYGIRAITRLTTIGPWTIGRMAADPGW
jgi:tRNA G37 N-methylase TrmD